MVALSRSELDYIEGGVKHDLRSDGRGRYHFRNLSIQVGIIPQANGSARVRLGGTDLIVSVKAELGSPRSCRPNYGSIEVMVECSATAGPEFEGRGGEDLNMELSRALQRCFVGGPSGAGAAIDLSTLGIVASKFCWELFVDCLVVNSDGNLLDALSIGVKAALSNTGIPSVKVTGNTASEDDADLEVGDNPDEFARLDASKVPLIITLTKIGRHYIVDATPEEEMGMSSAVSVAVNSKGLILGLTKRGDGGLDPSVVTDMISVAKHIARDLIVLVDTEIAAAELRAAENQ
ncbi:exosome complex component RRP42 [Selaginella moellendorffii]|uniref:exosome complex component RRP42 n=1 Tax=Selaginella moellendorffii TaxID=88036 RepID=UPI000D1D0B1A|nr:exosome complex component RRP42 [Selaginella moellendorffii]|eukprot:XP_024538320.1 exosome complex component RRP42 [Selaginella moellendorffii]